MRILGCDPGLSGALAWYDTDTGTVEIEDMPVLALVRGGKNKREIDTHALARMLLTRQTGHAFVEKVNSMPGQGVSSVFAFGKACGIIEGCLVSAGVPITFVQAKKWKHDLGVPAAKDGARARASQLLPQAADRWTRVKDDGRAEAAMISVWGARHLNAIASAAA